MPVRPADSSRKLVYIPMAADIVHPGHLNIINEGAKLGDVVVGLLTDQAIAGYKRVPFMPYDQRLAVVSALKGVTRVIPQASLDYRPNLIMLRPHYLVHSTDWRKGVMSGPRQAAIDTIAQWGGQLVEPDHTEGISSTRLQQAVAAAGITPAARMARLQTLLAAKPTLRALEAHNGLSALVVERTTRRDPDGRPQSFDAIWISSLTDSAARGLPDTELVDRSTRLSTINDILAVTTKPLIVDADTGGHAGQFAHTVRSLERLGVSAVVIEDKTGLKRNSLHAKAGHMLADPAEFATKLRAGLQARLSPDFMVFARVESLVAGNSVDDALTRARTYLETGASGIMVHTKNSDAADIKQFTAAYNRFAGRRPLMLVPTSYNHLYEHELAGLGANIIVYANHLLRAAYPAMEQVAGSILVHRRAREADNLCLPVTDLLDLIEER